VPPSFREDFFNRDEMQNLRGPSIDASCKMLLYLVKWFDFLEIDQPETRIAYLRPCLLTYLDKMSNLYRGPSIDASYQVVGHLA